MFALEQSASAAHNTVSAELDLSLLSGAAPDTTAAPRPPCVRPAAGRACCTHHRLSSIHRPRLVSGTDHN